MKRSVCFRSLGLALVVAAGFACRAPQPPAPKPPPVSRPTKPRPPAPPARPATVEEVVARYGPAVDARLAPLFARAGVPYPPSRLHLLAFKKERKIELWAEGGGRRAFVRSFPLLGASGRAGPKLEEGDWQVPEGVYSIAYLNPQSAYHLSLKVDYPNDFDRDKARTDGRTDLGGDIFIHGQDLFDRLPGGRQHFDRGNLRAGGAGRRPEHPPGHRAQRSTRRAPGLARPALPPVVAARALCHDSRRARSLHLALTPPRCGLAMTWFSRPRSPFSAAARRRRRLRASSR